MLLSLYYILIHIIYIYHHLFHCLDKLWIILIGQCTVTLRLRHCTSTLLLRLSASNMASRLEINFIRLLSRCESIASEKRGEAEWRLEKVRRFKMKYCRLDLFLSGLIKLELAWLLLLALSSGCLLATSSLKHRHCFLSCWHLYPLKYVQILKWKH